MEVKKFIKKYPRFILLCNGKYMEVSSQRMIDSYHYKKYSEVADDAKIIPKWVAINKPIFHVKVFYEPEFSQSLKNFY